MPHCLLPSKLLLPTLGHVKGTVFTQIIIICFVIMTMLIFLIATMQIFLIVMFFLLHRKSTTAITPSLSSAVSPSTSTSRYRPQKLNALNACYVSVSLQITKTDAGLEAKKCTQSEILSKIKGMELSKANLLNDQIHIMQQILTMRSSTAIPDEVPNESFAPENSYPIPNQVPNESFSSENSCPIPNEVPNESFAPENYNKICLAFASESHPIYI